MDKEQNNQKDDKALHIADVSGSLGTNYWVTPQLRYKMKQVGKGTYIKEELRLQQMWQGQDGSQKWEWVDVVE